MSETKCPNCGESIDEESIVCPQCRYVVMKEDDEPDEDFFAEENILPEGTVIADDYRIVRMVGMGGAGTVYEARQISLQNVPVALKVLHPDLSEDPNTIALLKKEVIIARELTHDNIMKVFSLGMTDGRSFIVMEYFSGQSLQDILDRSGKCAFGKAAAILVQVCDALQYAHDRGIIHLDIKPANILVGPVGNVKLCDFGIARMAISNVTTATQRIITGSVGFMPPEQYRGRKFVSHKSDIYALGASYYAAVTGEVPIGILNTEGIPKCILRAMERNPDNRFESVEEFHNAFIEETGYVPSSAETSRPRVTLTREIVPQRPEESETHIAAAAKPKEPIEPPPTEDKHEEPARPAVPIPVEAVPTEEPEAKAEEPPVAERVAEPEKPTEPAWPAQLVKKPAYLAAAAGLIVAVIAVIVVSISGREETPKTTRAPVASKPASTSKEAVKTPTRVTDEPARPPEASFADVKTVKADEETTREVQSILSKFLEMLNFDRVHQSYMFLSKDLRSQVPPKEFSRIFFASPRLWKTEAVEVGKTPDGKILMRFQLKVMDAYLGTVKTVPGAVEMIQRDTGWKITQFRLG